MRGDVVGERVTWRVSPHLRWRVRRQVEDERVGGE